MSSGTIPVCMWKCHTIELYPNTVLVLAWIVLLLERDNPALWVAYYWSIEWLIFAFLLVSLTFSQFNLNEKMTIVLAFCLLYCRHNWEWYSDIAHPLKDPAKRCVWSVVPRSTTLHVPIPSLVQHGPSPIVSRRMSKLNANPHKSTTIFNMLPSNSINLMSCPTLEVLMHD